MAHGILYLEKNSKFGVSDIIRSNGSSNSESQVPARCTPAPFENTDTPPI